METPVRQRNDHDHPLTVHTDPPQVVEPGQVIDHDDHVIGLTAVDKPDTTALADEPVPEPVDEQPTRTKPTKTTGKEATR
jgi:hypothetical protein